MNRVVRLFAFALIAFMLAIGGCAHKKITSESAVPQTQTAFDVSKFNFYERMVHSTVIVGKGCAGGVLKNDGKDSFILTANHCMAPFEVKSADGKISYKPINISTSFGWKAKCLGTVVKTDEKSDLAAITVSNCYLPTTYALVSPTYPKLGDTVFVVGHPAGARYVMTKGMVGRTKIMGNEERGPRMLVTAQAAPGNSGGPVFNKRGQIVGIVSASLATVVYLPDGEPFPLYVGIPHLQLSIPQDSIIEFLKDIK